MPPAAACPSRQRQPRGAPCPAQPPIAAGPRPRATIARRRGGERQQRREPVDAGDAGELRDGQHRRPGCSREAPRESRPNVLAPQLGRHPHGAARAAPRSVRRPEKPRTDHGEGRGKKREVGDEQRRREHRDRRREPAEGRHRLDEPVQRAGEVDARRRRGRGRTRGERSWSRRVPAPTPRGAASARAMRRRDGRTSGSSGRGGRPRAALARESRGLNFSSFSRRRATCSASSRSS